MDFARALTYLFADPRWFSKFAIASALAAPPSILSLLGLLATRGIVHPALERFAASPLWTILVSLIGAPVLGFVLRITRNVVDGAETPLPAWDDFGGLLRDGVKVWAVITTWSLPILFLRPVSGPILGVVISVLAMFLQPAAEARLAVTDSLASAFDLTAVVTLVRRNFSRYLQLLIVPILGIFLVGLVLGIAGLLVWQLIDGRPGVREVGIVSVLLGLLTLMTYGRFVLYHLYGQAYARAA